MKKLLILILIIFINGCSKQNSIHILNIQTINYDNIRLIEDDFNKVKRYINALNFTESKKPVGDFKDLNIVSSEKIHNFKISDNTIYYEEDSKYYISKNSFELSKSLENMKKEYTDFSFFQLDYVKCNSIDYDLNIKINLSENCLIIDTSKILFNFKIHSLDEKTSNEIDLLYENEEIDPSKISIKFLILTTPKIKISFQTKYNYTISILPTFDGKLELNSSYVQSST